MKWLKRLIGGEEHPTRVTTLSNPLVIHSPRLRFVNLLGASAASLLAADKAALSQLFRDSRELSSVGPCDVLMLYCQVQGDGRDLKSLIASSAAPIVVVASENTGEAYVQAAKSKPHEYTNLVLTIARNGSSFEHFFHALFEKMFSGITMPVAWAEVAPQTSRMIHADAPETIFACGAGHIRFESSTRLPNSG